jgi:muramoyltetrapeptide carboxypeptidase LdcA involved in peptidoglycan recycling
MMYPPKPVPGDRVAIVSPACGLPEEFPEVTDLGLERLRTVFGLEPVEYPTTRRLVTPPAERAADLHAAFADPSVKAVLATIGGDDQITVLPHLDPDLLRANPKPFFGYSDNTNLLHYLWNLGIVGYHGGSVMVHLGRAGALHPVHEKSLRLALFESGWFDLEASPDWGDEPVSWAEPHLFGTPPPMWPTEGWLWYGSERVVQGRSWGGNIEILSWLLQVGYVLDSDAYAGGVLFLETSEEMPPAVEVYRTLRNMGERGLLGQFSAVLFARAQAWERYCARRASTTRTRRWCSMWTSATPTHN